MIPRSIKQQYPIDPITVEILRAVAAACSEGADYMLVGATARDILLKHVFGIEPERATYDVDFAVAVEDWQQFDALKREGIIEAVKYDPVLAGVVLLAKDMARLVSTETLGLLRQIIDRDFDRLVLEMIRSKRTLDDVRQQVERQLRLLRESLS